MMHIRPRVSAAAETIAPIIDRPGISGEGLALDPHVLKGSGCIPGRIHIQTPASGVVDPAAVADANFTSAVITFLDDTLSDEST